jgi:hypothetical protein
MLAAKQRETAYYRQRDGIVKSVPGLIQHGAGAEVVPARFLGLQMPRICRQSVAIGLPPRRPLALEAASGLRGRR